MCKKELEEAAKDSQSAISSGSSCSAETRLGNIDKVSFVSTSSATAVRQHKAGSVNGAFTDSNSQSSVHTEQHARYQRLQTYYTGADEDRNESAYLEIGPSEHYSTYELPHESERDNDELNEHVSTTVGESERAPLLSKADAIAKDEVLDAHESLWHTIYRCFKL